MAHRGRKMTPLMAKNRSIPCSYCGAMAGEPCRTMVAHEWIENGVQRKGKLGTVLGFVHIARLRLVQKESE